MSKASAPHKRAPPARPPVNTTASSSQPIKYSERIKQYPFFDSSASVQCSLCYEQCAFVGQGVCGHREICWLCCVRMRWICKDTNCAICKESLDTIEIVPTDKSSRNVDSTVYSMNGVSTREKSLYQELARLMGYFCPFACSYRFRALSDLQTHLKRDHEILFCQVCLENRQCFVPEQILYPADGSSTDLAHHIKSNHPSCEFCKKNFASPHTFYSQDELIAHMNQTHFKCGVCDRLDYQNEYYANFENFAQHSSESHFACDFPECKEQRLVAFADEDELRLHCIEKHRAAIGGSNKMYLGSSRGAGQHQKKYRNKYNQGGHLTMTVHFRGGRGHIGTGNSTQTAVVPLHQYADDSEGVPYDRRIHKCVLQNGHTGLIEEFCRSVVDVLKTRSEGAYTFPPVTTSSPEYRAKNIAYLQQLEGLLGSSAVGLLKTAAKEFREGTIRGMDFVARWVELTSSVKEGSPALLVDLISLMPDSEKQQALVTVVRHMGPSAVVSKKKVIAPPHCLIPEDLFDTSLPGDRKPSLLHALHNLLSGGSDFAAPRAQKEMTQSTLSAMENKILGLDRVQLSTLSEMRNHLLCLAEGVVDTNKNTWTYADAVVSLRPLLYRLMHVPESHRSKTRELESAGWSEFAATATELFRKFNPLELLWINTYVTLSLLRVGNLGPLDVKRKVEFPSLEVKVAAPVPNVVPTRSDFPIALSAGSAPSTSASTAQWKNNINNLRDFEAFPDLPIGSVVVPMIANSSASSSAVVSSRTPTSWNCPRCTCLNTRLLTTECEICGMPRPDEDSLGARDKASADKSKKGRKVILSSTNQRDYHR